MVFPPQQAASWSDKPSDLGAQLHTRGESRHPYRGTLCIRVQTPVCTDEWHRRFVPAAPQGPQCAFLVGPANSYLKEQTNRSLLISESCYCNCGVTQHHTTCRAAYLQSEGVNENYSGSFGFSFWFPLFELTLNTFHFYLSVSDLKNYQDSGQSK